ncbi:structural maintenance of chromosomes protein 6-like [Anopheles darlingi]|uniref:structural maintenance of chromosomes protein 6-like n=1 Tax=Anopheles darlingi TaxID=43151 RepID=UPI0021006119|nr:structural maintenance of chromosomes protein 6-like [Anopheles darlingi]
MKLPSQDNVVQTEESEDVRNGKVLRMELKNFMCHRHLVIEFNKSVNLLVGKNGSGKSAIVAALTVGLGCNAMQTNRGSSLKDLIKHGEPQAVIEIHLENGNFNGFDQERYGNRIVCQRTIYANGKGSYKLTDANGHTISTSRSELQKILLAFNIQVDNPICVLNQDLARSLLIDSDESKQYMFFAKATQIDEIQQKLRDCSLITQRARRVLSVREKGIEYLHQEVETLEGKFRRLEVTELLSALLKNLQAQLAWRCVTDKERKLTEIDQELERIRASIEKRKAQIDKRGALVEETNRTVQMLSTDIEAKKIELANLRTEYMQFRKAMQVALTEQENIELLKQNTSDKLERLLEEMYDVEQELNNRSQSDVNQEQEKEEMALRERLEELVEQIEKIEEELEKMHIAVMELDDTRAQRRHERLAKHSKVMRLEEELEQLKKSPDNKLTCYGHNMPALDARIRQLYREGKFSELPRGPLGQYIEVRDRKWASIVEIALGSRILSAFFVATSQDWRTLNELLEREFPNLHKRTILTGRFVKELYDVEQQCVQELDGTHLLMNLIKVADPVVMNRLIDSAAIDTILVTEQQRIAIQLTSEKETVPNNLTKVIVRDPCVEFYPKPIYRSYAKMFVQSRYLQVSMDELRQRTEQHYEVMQHELRQLKVAEDQAHKAHGKQIRWLRLREQHLSKLRNAKYLAEQRLDELVASMLMRQKKPEESTLRWELEALQTESAELREKLDMQQYRLDASQSEVHAQKDEVLKKKKAMADTERMIHAIQRHIEDEQQKREDLRTTEQMNLRELQRCEEGMRERMAVRSVVAEAVEQARAEALTLGSRVETTETTEQLKRQISSTEKRIRKMLRTSDIIEDVKFQLDLKIKEWEEAKQYTGKLRDIISLLNKTRKSRYAYLDKLISHMSLRVKHKFKHIMQVGHFARKKIHIDCEAGTLELDVVPRATNVQDAVCTTNALSGGERSYTTVAFLIALWSCIDSPFFVLDEYDVFTDKINRHFMTNLLLDEAKKKPDRQFCFLTPQEVDGLEAARNLTIHR